MTDVRGPGQDVLMTPAVLLDFETRWPRHSGYKETAIIEELGLAPARYYVLLLRAASSIEGQACNPITAHRVLRRSSANNRVALRI